MKLSIRNAPWVADTPSAALIEAVEILKESTWREAATEFYAVRAARLRVGRQAPKGVQSFLNKVVDQRFADAHWDGAEGRYRKSDTWVRVTFRHQMSLGSDFLDALRLTRKEGVSYALIAAASYDFLKLISPNDAGALVSYEKLWSQTAELKGVVDIPLFIGRLSPVSTLPQEVATAVARDRPRDQYSPSGD